MKQRAPKGELQSIFANLAAGDVVMIPIDKYKLSSLRTCAGNVNTVVGYTKYSVNLAPAIGQIIIKNNEPDTKPAPRFR